MSRARPRPILGDVVMRSFFPLAALTIIGGAALWGPWVTLLLALVCWRVVARIG